MLNGVNNSFKYLTFASNVYGLFREGARLENWAKPSLSNGHTREKFVQFFIAVDSQLSCKCWRMILVFLLSRDALPANSETSAAKYSRTAAR